jgi:hypothetical protein
VERRAFERRPTRRAPHDDYVFAFCGALLGRFDAEAVVKLMLHSIGVAAPSA